MLTGTSPIQALQVSFHSNKVDVNSGTLQISTSIGPKLRKNQLSSSELLSNVYLMLAAGFETTSTALGYCTYRLAIHRDIQEKIYREIIKYKPSDLNSYETITNK
ncbi:unnamed protein product [Rotaria magnacalcarata]|uniref:Cytochrome P450 n=1 Tax=Rotaria magnacalcarata TaxID=392030 RepID=A0A815YBB9_9BILA|nr:unnamed protein product [Rotaria magnacalcarata]CAF2076035.1 unnamed protein product [Rotaria magnacalcarata]CAF2149998.1 unnamed protein product [Rotaria magnacalcarata]CAF4137732.1 unnamed protein product [Rotaria magnacalcarata]